MTVLDLKNFGGGLNLRDSFENLSPGETPDALNMTLTTRGAVQPRNGCVQVSDLPSGAIHVYYSPTLVKWFAASGTTIYIKNGDLSGSWGVHLTGFGPNTRFGFADFGSLVVITSWDPATLNAVNVHTSDGTTCTQRTITAGGASIAVFKNRVWVCGYQDEVLGRPPPRVWFSALGDPTTWNTTTDYVDIREKDARSLHGFGGNVGNGLLVFKKNSAYKITDATTGAYQTLDWATGCVGAYANATLRGLTYTWSRDGIYAWDGNGRGVLVGDRIRPRYLTAGSWNTVASTYLDRVLFAYEPDITNGRMIELQAADTIRSDYLPAAGWLMEHVLAEPSLRITGFTKKDDELYAGLGTGARIYKMFTETPGADNGVNFESYYKTPPLTLGRLSRPERIRVYGKAAAAATSTKELRTYRDWQTSVDETFDLTSSFETADGEEVQDLFSLDHAEAHQLEFRTRNGTGTAELSRLLVDLTELER